MIAIDPKARANVTLIDHPLVQHKLTLMRKKEASTSSFRRLLNELAGLMIYEVCRDLPLQDVQIETPLETMTAKVIDGKKLVFASILRAGNGILDGVLNVVPGARVGHIGLYRDPKTLQAVEYYFKMPKNMEERDIIVVDPMLATGNSAAAAVTRLKACNPKSIKFLCLLTCPEGINTMYKEHPDVPIFTAAIDRELNDHGYIMPGLGDAGDRIFGTQYSIYWSFRPPALGKYTQGAFISIANSRYCHETRSLGYTRTGEAGAVGCPRPGAGFAATHRRRGSQRPAAGKHGTPACAGPDQPAAGRGSTSGELAPGALRGPGRKVHLYRTELFRPRRGSWHAGATRADRLRQMDQLHQRPGR
jgi:uracil phosphoribosyltransferase